MAADAEGEEVGEWQWNVGDWCQATYRGDGKLYQAVIKRIRRKRSGQLLAQVEFLGFEEDGLETVLISDLVPLKKEKRRATFLGSSEETVTAGETSIIQRSSLSSNRQEVVLLSQAVREKYELLERESVLNVIENYPDDVDCEHKKPVKGKKRKRETLFPGEANGQAKMAANSEVSDVEAGASNLPQEALFSVDGFDDIMDKPCFDMAPTRSRMPYRLSSSGDFVFEIPSPLNQYLRDYQQQGVQFIYDHYMMKQGAVLGDDMGLGKTIQVIAFLSAMLKKTNTKDDLGMWKRKLSEQCVSRRNDHPLFLIVCPASVLYNWKDELDTWGHFRYAVFHQDKKADAMDRASKRSIEIMLTTYETVKRNKDWLESLGWAASIFDEVHRLKDPNTQVTTCMKAMNLGVRIGLTGTAVQNNLMELWSLLDWANPGCLGSAADFEQEWVQPMLEGQRYDSTKRELAVTRTKQGKLSKIIGKWFLRRTKSLIAGQLPQKDERIVFCQLTPLQVSIYQTMLKNNEFQLVIRAMEPCDCGSGKSRGRCCYKCNSEGVKWRFLILPFLTLLMKVCSHVGLLLPQSKASEKQRYKSEEICEEVFANHHEFVHMTRQASFQTLSNPAYCGKMQVLDKLLRVFKEEGSRVALFSQSTQLLDFITDFVMSCGYEYCRMDGSTPVNQRPNLVRSFNKDKNKFLFLVSKGTGGVGLNLTGANVVIIYDPCWNPQTDMQAQDRCYRLGQSRDVKVFRFVCQGTVEESVYLREVYKQQLSIMALEGEPAQRHFTCVAGDKKRKGEIFGHESMFKLRLGDSCLTADILKRTAELYKGIRVARDELAYCYRAKEQDGIEEGASEGPSKFVSHYEDDVYSLTSVASQLASEMDEERSPEDKCSKPEATSKNRSSRGKSRSSTNAAVDSALALCGVKYTHTNDSVIRSTRLEQKISAQAIEDVMDHHQNSQVAANVFQIEGEIKTGNQKKKRSHGKGKGAVHSRRQSRVKQLASPMSNDISMVVGKTPTAIRHEQFSHLVGLMRVDSSVQAAKIIISSSSEDRNALLKRLYCSDAVTLSSLLDKGLGGDSNSSLLYTCQDEQRSSSDAVHTSADGDRNESASCGETVTAAQKHEVSSVATLTNWHQVHVNSGGLTGTSPKPATIDSMEESVTLPSSSSMTAIDIDEFLFG